jgi:DNA-binding NarL/FixJ family response regulator
MKRVVVIVDAHPAVAHGVSQALLAAMPDLEVRCATSAAQCRRLTMSNPVGEELEQKLLVFVDAYIGGGEGSHLIRELSEQRVPVVAMCEISDSTTVRDCSVTGATAIVSKIANLDLYPALATLIFSGAAFLSTDLLRYQSTASQASSEGLLTARQRDVLGLLRTGKPNKIIARTLGLSEGTVKNYVSHLLEHYEVTSRAQLILRTQ